ncbi:hypothetical protein BASA81_003530 [Batrachochytrium salamandrivorans]|nr:hypothetical protein BASA81_003530 [Batrachochytrium salamandrivorans]
MIAGSSATSSSKAPLNSTTACGCSTRIFALQYGHGNCIIPCSSPSLSAPTTTEPAPSLVAQNLHCPALGNSIFSHTYPKPIKMEPVAKRKLGHYDERKQQRRSKLRFRSDEWWRMCWRGSDFKEYHHGFASQVELWPTNPCEVICSKLEKRKRCVIGDFGCGNARLQQALKGKHKVHSFDLVASHPASLSVTFPSTYRWRKRLWTWPYLA